MFTDESGKRTVGFCLWCGTDFHSTEEFESHNADEMAACPVYQQLKGEDCMPPVFQLMLEDAELPADPAENDSGEGEGLVATGQFELGRVVATPGALAALEESGEQSGDYIRDTPLETGETTKKKTGRKMNFRWHKGFDCFRRTNYALAQ